MKVHLIRTANGDDWGFVSMGFCCGVHVYFKSGGPRANARFTNCRSVFESLPSTMRCKRCDVALKKEVTT